MVNNVRTRIGNAVTASSSARLRFEVVGNSLKLVSAGSLLVDVTDSMFALPGTVGFRGTQNATFDDFVMTR